MIVKLKYEDVKGNTLKVDVDGKETMCYMRVAVNSDNVIEAVSALKGYKNVVAFDYTGDIQTLEGLETYNTPICVKYTLDVVDNTIDDIMASVPETVRVIIGVPSDFCNMQVIEEYSNKYQNIRFCGGHFIRLEGCNIGCIGVEDIPRKIHANRIKLECRGCACAYENTDINDFDIVTFTNEVLPVKEPKVGKVKEKEPKAPTPKAPPKKKAISSILALAKEKGVVEF